MAKDETLDCEVSVLLNSDHDNIVKYYGWFSIDNETTGLVMEACHGSLKDVVKKRDFAVDDVKILVKQILYGLAYIHNNGCIHRYLVRFISIL